MDTYRAARNLDTVDHGVVCLCSDAAEQFALAGLDGLAKQFEVLIHRRRKRMMRGVVMVLGVVVLKQRKVHDEQRFKNPERNEALAFCDLDPQGPESGR